MTTNNKDFKIKGNLNVGSGVASGNEGGQIDLVAAPSGSLSGTSVVIDVYANKLRIFEQGGTNRGAYVDLSAATAGVGSNLLSGGGGSSLVVQAGTPSTTDALWLDTDEPSATMIPTGGTTNQVLAKIDATDYNTQWVSQSGGSADSKPDIFMLMGG